MQNIKTEEDIMLNWSGEPSRPVVSICCITFNHERFIEEAICGFLIQETNFPFEVIIHDDASTDNTAKIINEYKNRYPNIIKTIIQTENQFSLNFHKPFLNVVSKASGEFIALCEGDDYWCSANKLQTQVDYMYLHPEINISFHPSYTVDNMDAISEKIISKHSDNIKIFQTRDVILGDGDFMPTQSLMIKANILKNLPKWFTSYAPVGDYYVQIICSHGKGALFLPFVFSAYRTNISGSWSSSQNNKNKRLKLIDDHYKTLLQLNTYCNGVYDREIRLIFTKYLFVTTLKNLLGLNDFLSLFSRYKPLLTNNNIFSFIYYGFIMSLRSFLARVL